MGRKKTLKVQLVEYFVSGGAFFWSGYVAFAVFDSVLHLPLFIAKQSANLIGLTINYILEDRWVFKHPVRAKKHNRRKTSRYLIITFVNFGIDYLIVAGLKNVGISPYLGQFASAGFFTFWNFFWYKYWVFAPHPSRKKSKRSVR